MPYLAVLWKKCARNDKVALSNCSHWSCRSKYMSSMTICKTVKKFEMIYQYNLKNSFKKLAITILHIWAFITIQKSNPILKILNWLNPCNSGLMHNSKIKVSLFFSFVLSIERCVTFILKSCFNPLLQKLRKLS